MTTQRHRDRIAEILARRPGAKTTGFGEACNRIICLYPAARFRLGVIPDAFHVDQERRRVTVYEVEETCPVSADKMALYVDLWWGLDDMEWSLVLVRLTRDGDERAIDIGDHSLNKLAEVA